MKFLLAFLPALALSATAFAQGANPFSASSKDADKPIGISADTILADVKNQTATYAGNVVVSQGELRLRSDTLSIQANKGEVRRIQAKGNVVLASAQGQATGALADYDVTGRMVTMTGKVVLSQGQNVMRGSRLVVNLATGQAQLSSTPGVTGSGRVEGLFVPEKRREQKPKPAPSAAPAAPPAAPAAPAPTSTP